VTGCVVGGEGADGIAVGDRPDGEVGRRVEPVCRALECTLPVRPRWLLLAQEVRRACGAGVDWRVEAADRLQAADVVEVEVGDEYPIDGALTPDLVDRPGDSAAGPGHASVDQRQAVAVCDEVDVGAGEIDPPDAVCEYRGHGYSTVRRLKTGPETTAPTAEAISPGASVCRLGRLAVDDRHRFLPAEPDAGMKAVQFSEHGDRDVIEYGDYPDPVVGSEEVLVDVKAGALNHLDVWTRRGLPTIDVEMPHVPGSDAAGVVDEVGEDVSRFEPGDRVAVAAGRYCGECEFCRDGDTTRCVNFQIIGEHVPGVHAERAAVPSENLVPVPEGVAWETAAAAPLVFQTAWRMLLSRGDLQPGESVLVLGASGGVGHAAVQIAAHAGAEVYATASTDRKLEYAAEVGADHTIDYETEDFPATIRELTGGRGVDVVVDHVGAATWRDSLKSLAKGGRVLTCGATTGGRPETDLNRIFWNQLEVIGSTMGTPGEVDDVLELVWEGALEPRIRETLPMSETARAHERIEEREGFGKVVVIPDSEHDG
jgi:NADPH:quinone reductase-like Zn-dependent oxidoreductase